MIVERTRTSAAKLALLGAFFLGACGPSGQNVVPRWEGRAQFGDATYYGRWHHGKLTANGERFNMWAMTAAHLHLKMNTIVRVTNLRNGRYVLVRINDRGPYGNPRRIIDLSYGAAEKLNMIVAGVVPVRVEILAP